MTHAYYATPISFAGHHSLVSAWFLHVCIMFKVSCPCCSKVHCLARSLPSESCLMHVAGADTLLGPEMRSTGEVMGIDSDFSKAYAKAALAAGQKLPASGNVFVSMTDKYKEAIVPIAKELKVDFMFPLCCGCVYAVAALKPKPNQYLLWPNAGLTESIQCREILPQHVTATASTCASLHVCALITSLNRLTCVSLATLVIKAQSMFYSVMLLMSTCVSRLLSMQLAMHDCPVVCCRSWDTAF